MPSVELVLFVLALLFFISIFVTKAGARFGVPVLLLFLAVGMIFGSDGMGIDFRNFEVAQAVGTFALCVILFSGGLDTKLEEVRPVAKPGVVLATMGVLLTAVFTGLFIYLFVNMFLTNGRLTLLEAMLLASIMSSTDSASVFAVLRSRGVGLKHNLRPLLEFESGSNDPMAYMLTITLIQLIMMDTTPSVTYVLVLLLVQLTVGGVLGYVLGKLSVKLINRINLPNEAMYPVLLFTLSILIFAVTYFLKGNGFLAVYIGGLVVGNSRFINKRSSLKFFEAFAWISQITMFLTLGLLVNPRELLPIAIPSILIGIFMIVLGRPLSVFVSLLPFKFGWNDKFFLSWVGLRGAVPIVFAILPLVAGVPHAQDMFNIVFFITLLSLFIQGSSLSAAADKLKLSEESNISSKSKGIDMDIDDLRSFITELTVKKDVLVHGKKLVDIELPENTLVVMINRNGKFFIPKGNTEIEAGDKLLVIADDETTLKGTYEVLGLKYTGVKGS